MSVLQRQLRMVLSRPRLFTSLLIAYFIFLLIPEHWIEHLITRVILAWNIGIWLYLVLAMHLMLTVASTDISSRAQTQDEDKYVILGMVILSAVVAICAIVAELGVVKNMHGLERILHVGLTVVTIVFSWAFTQTMFALHYAHDYYFAMAEGEEPGLAFPGKSAPDYLDFLYFSCVIGTSGQTADISLTTPAMRRIGMIHCVLAFFFNTTLIALTINIASGLI